MLVSTANVDSRITYAPKTFRRLLRGNFQFSKLVGNIVLMRIIDYGDNVDIHYCLEI